MRRALLLLIFLPFLAAVGQDSQPAPTSLDARGHLSGSVTDPTDAVIPGATVAVHSLKGGSDKTTTTDNIGRFQFQGLALGQYTVIITRDGFADFHGKFTLTPAKASANLDARLKIATAEEHVDVDTRSNTLDPNNNPDGVTLNQQQVDTLPDDPGLLSQELQGLAGSTQAQIYVDGFSGGTIPPKNMIREIRINQNAYSAKNDTDPIEGFIEIFTKPGTDTLHGFFLAYGNTSALDAKNPFYPNQPPYYSYSWYGDVSGPLAKRASYFLTANQSALHTNQTISAVILTPDNNSQVPFTQALPAISNSFFFNPRVDLQVAKNDTLSIRYQLSRSTQNNGGVGGINLESQGFDSQTLVQTLQLSNSQTIHERFVNETRFEYERTRTSQNPYSTAPSLTVQGAFSDGGSPSGQFHDNQDHYEFQDYASIAPAKHFLNFGVRLRSTRDANNSAANFNGQYTFASIDTYQITEQGLEQNWTPAEIRAAGGGASQFTITTGNPSVAASMTDLGLFFEDDWKWKPSLTLSGGLRYETQNHISDYSNVAPRLGFAWNFGPKKSPFTLSAGNGLFYHRFPVTNILNAERQNGVNQQQYVLQSPDTYPAIPDTSKLVAEATPSTYEINPHYRAEVVYVASTNLSHSIFKTGRLSVNYWYARGMHDPLIRNINAPLPGTYDPSDPNSGVRPFGGTNNIYQYDSAGLSRYYRLMPNFFYQNGKGMFITANYQMVWYTTDASGGSFPSNSYDIGVDKGPGYLDIRHRVTAGGSVPLPLHFNASFWLEANTDPPFNIVVGQDLNGDSIFNDRPAFATDLSRPSVVATKWGTFDTNPLPTQQIIPYNYGRAPGTVFSSLILSRNFSFGPEQKHAPGAKGPVPRKYGLSLTAVAGNVLNHPNLAPPNPTLGSPLFGKSQNLSGSPRSINFQTSFHF
jgi:Carboxypeptidase regulatory-like domain